VRVTDVQSYYGRPVLKEPTWTWQVPTYLFTGGVAGASSVLSLSAKLFGNDELSKRALYIGAAADVVNPMLLIWDLGRPERFHHMLRVFKVTSPMNVGAWILAANANASMTAAALERFGVLKPLKLLAEFVSFLSGPPLATYTGVLLADTAIPVWHEAREELPWLFGASAAASAGAAACVFCPPGAARPARRLAVAGVVAEGLVMHAMQLRLGESGEVYHQGTAGKFSWAAKSLAASGALLLSRRGRRGGRAAVLGGALVCAGELCLRFAVHHAGKQSARDPKYVVKPQRERADRDGTRATIRAA
jgi:formate-dependent nitrite reductase membrane component NrfD